MKYLQVDNCPERGDQNYLELDIEPETIREGYTGLKTAIKPPSKT